MVIDVFCEDVNMPTYTGDPAWTTLGTHRAGPSEPSFLSDYRIVASPGVVVTSSVNGKHSAATAAFRSQ